MSELAPVLAGSHLLVTAQRRSDELAGALTRRGARVRVTPMLGVESGIDEPALIAATRSLLADGVDTVVVTTAIGFRGWCEAVDAVGLLDELLTVLGSTRLVARGPKARGALQAVGLRADWVAESETSSEIVDFLLSEGVAGERVAIQHHGAGDPSLERRLAEGGAVVVPLEVYRWGPAPDPAAVDQSALDCAAGVFDAVLFTSAPAALAWLDALSRQGVSEIVSERISRGELLVAAVGPVTGDPLIGAGFLARWPERSRMGALVRLVISELGEAAGVETAAGRLRLRASAATLDNEVLPLAPSGLALLRRLARRPGEVVAKEALLDVLPGTSDDPHTVEVTVARLRDVLGASRPLVRTVIKRGYQLQIS